VTAISSPPTAIAPDRDEVAVFPAIEKASVALPVPVVGPVSVIHEGLADAVQSQVGADAVSVIFPLTPAAGASMVDGDTVKVHVGGGGGGGDGGPDCVTVTAWPAMLRDACREDVPV
jgi:hypothetical protein